MTVTLLRGGCPLRPPLRTLLRPSLRTLLRTLPGPITIFFAGWGMDETPFALVAHGRRDARHAHLVTTT